MGFRFSVHSGRVTQRHLVNYTGTGTREWLLTDERGSVIGRADNIGNVSGITAYDEYGHQNTGNPGTYGYTGMVRVQHQLTVHLRAVRSAT